MQLKTRPARLADMKHRTDRRSDRRAGRLWGWLAALVAVGAAGAVAAWAAFAVLRPADDPTTAKAVTYATVSEGDVQASMNLNTTAQWTPEPVGVNQAAGVITAVNIVPGDQVSQGGQLFTVDLRPVVAAQGDVPAFRTIEKGSRGADVEQMQRLLSDTGFYTGQIDGEVGALTEEAIRAWQKSLDVEATGTVALGDVIFVPKLPSRLALDTEKIKRGQTLTGGELAVESLPPSPSFVIPATDAQASSMPAGTKVEITSPNRDTWQAVVSGQERDQQSQTTKVFLSGPDGNSICNDECAQVPVVGEALLLSRIITVNQVSGLVVPSAALITDADGMIYLVDESDARIPVEVIQSARGMSVIEGVEAGTKVRLPE